MVENILPLLLKSIEGVLRHSDWNLVISSGQLGPGRLDVLVQWHSHRTTILHVGLVLGVVKLGLNRWWEELDHLDVTRT